MYLQKLEIQGFKSFAEKATLEFNRQLTAVVGPNGSGKSNVADAVRWVLGEQSLKVLRGKKSQDVIFAGSTSKPRLGMAEVSLYLNNEDGQADLDYREIVITRRLYRDGESEYLVNKNKVRLLDVQMILAKANFGQRTYAIIGQGMVDSILTSSPQERKEFFDEATGVRQYQLKKEQALLKLEHSQENLAQSEQVLAEIEPRLKSLSRQVKKLERRAELESELKIKQAVYYGDLRSGSEKELDHFKQELKTALEHKNTVEKLVRENRSALTELENADTEAAAWQKLQIDYQNLAATRDAKARELSAIEGKIAWELTATGKVDAAWMENRRSELLASKLTAERNLVSATEANQTAEIKWRAKEREQGEFLADFKRLQAEARQVAETTENFDLQAVASELAEAISAQESFFAALETEPTPEAWQKIKTLANDLLSRLRKLKKILGKSSGTDKTTENSWQDKFDKFLTTKDSLTNELQEVRLTWEMAKNNKERIINELAILDKEIIKINTEINSYSKAGGQNELLQKQKESLLGSLEKLEKELALKKEELSVFGSKQQVMKERFSFLQETARRLQAELDQKNNTVNELQLSLAKIEVKLEELEKEIAEECPNGLIEIKQEELIVTENLRSQILRLKEQLGVIGAIDAEVVKEYQEVNERHEFLSKQVIDLQEAIKSCRVLIKELDEKINTQFEEAFNKINVNFQHYFLVLFGGGKASLALQKNKIVKKTVEVESAENTNAENAEIEQAETNDNYEFGIEIQATPPGKKLKSIHVLSGGEKALTAIALISAIIANNPSPFVILDEVDAALDESNSVRFASIVHELSDKAQFICITHNRATMEQAAILYGVTMGSDGVSRLLSVNLEQAEKVLQ